MKAVILCAGDGNRLKPATENIPKPLLLVGRPILFYIFNSLPDKVDEVFLIIQEKHKILFRKFLEDNNIKIKVNILFQDKEKKGTYFALITAKDYLAKEDAFLVLNGDDIFLKEDLENLVKSCVPVYGLGYKKMNKRYRTCDLDLEKKRILSFRMQTDQEIEKEMPCFSGAFVLIKDFFDYKPVYTEGEAGIPHTLFGSGAKVYYVLLRKWFQINTPEDFSIAQKDLAGGKID
ncbi:MAG: NDP-sugar synthase [bacterium]